MAAWTRSNRGLIEACLARAGAVLLRGFAPPTLESFGAFMAAASDAPMEYRYRSTPRRALHPGVYTSTEYPASQTIPQHNEMSYARAWPGRVAFCCRIAPQTGGETPISDSRAVHARIPAEVRARFARHGVLYVRNYRPNLDLRWQDVFQTDDRAAVEAFCRAHEIDFEWKDGQGLITRQRCQATAMHPKTGETVWFNQAHLFHVSALERELQDHLLAEHGESGLPRHALLGDGSPIAPDDLAAIRDAYRAETVMFAWSPGDVLLLDNMLAAHGRAPFAGPRQIVVALADPSGASDAAMHEL